MVQTIGLNQGGIWGPNSAPFFEEKNQSDKEK